MACLRCIRFNLDASGLVEEHQAKRRYRKPCRDALGPVEELRTRCLRTKEGDSRLVVAIHRIFSLAEAYGPCASWRAWWYLAPFPLVSLPHTLQCQPKIDFFIIVGTFESVPLSHRNDDWSL